MYASTYFLFEKTINKKFFAVVWSISNSTAVFRSKNLATMDHIIMYEWREMVIISLGNCSCLPRSTLYGGQESSGDTWAGVFSSPSRPDKLDEVFSCCGKLAYFLASLPISSVLATICGIFAPAEFWILTEGAVVLCAREFKKSLASVLDHTIVLLPQRIMQVKFNYNLMVWQPPDSILSLHLHSPLPTWSCFSFLL